MEIRESFKGLKFLKDVSLIQSLMHVAKIIVPNVNYALTQAYKKDHILEDQKDHICDLNVYAAI